MKKNVSVIIPIYNESEGISYLLDQLASFPFGQYFGEYEFVFVNDGSTDDSLEVMKKQKSERGSLPLRIVSYPQNQGLSSAIKTGIEMAKFDDVLYVDSDLQVPLDQIEKFQESIAQDYDLISGLRIKRNDRWTKVLTTRIANHVRDWVLKDHCRDTGCPFKWMRREMALKLPLEYKGFHRFIPHFFAEMGGKIKFIEVQHRERLYGQSKFNFTNRLLGPVVDLFLIRSLKNRRKNPGTLEEF